MGPVRPQSLSFCITTRGFSERVRALLEQVRPHADEVVLAVDAAGDLEVLEACADLADRRLTFDLDGSPARLIGWILNQCSGDWILRLDDDEVPSPEMLEALPALMADGNLTEVGFRRRWPYGDPSRYIATAPWGVDFQVRLLRNLPGLWSFTGDVHTIGTRVAATRFVDECFYHCDLLVTTDEERRRKSLAYEVEAPGQAWDGFPLNSVYFPDAAREVETAEIPEAHRPIVEALLAGSSASAGPPRAPIEHADAMDVAAYSPGAPLPDEDMRATIEFVNPPATLPAGTMRHVEVTIRNDGTRRWPGGFASHPVVKVAFRWHGDPRPYHGIRIFTEPVEPGATTRVLLGVGTPLDPGDYELEVDAVHGDVRWFGCGSKLPIRIEPGDADGLLWAAPAHDRIAAGLLAKEVAELRRELEAERARREG